MNDPHEKARSARIGRFAKTLTATEYRPTLRLAQIADPFAKHYRALATWKERRADGDLDDPCAEFRIAQDMMVLIRQRGIRCAINPNSANSAARQKKSGQPMNDASISAEEALRDALRQNGITYNGPIHIDGRLHRFKAEGDHHENSWYALHSGSPVVGAFGCWKRHLDVYKWCERNSGSLTKAERRDVYQRQQEIRAKVEAETAARQEQARKKAIWILKRSRPARTLRRQRHRYLLRKQVKAFGDLRLRGYRLVVPLCDEKGELHSLQFIDGNGTKRFLPGGRVKGCFFTLADQANGPLVIAESYATSASIHEATGHAVISAMFCGNLLAVARAARRLWPEREIIIAAANDQWTSASIVNPGVDHATDAAREIGAKLAVPQFTDETNKPTDFNDLALAQGLDAVTQQIGAAKAPIEIDSENLLETGDTPPASRRAPLTIRTIDEILGMTFDEADLILPNGYLTAGDSTAVVGPGGIGKTRLTMQLAMCCRADRDFLGWPTNGRELRFLFLQTENSCRRLQADLEKMLSAFMPEEQKHIKAGIFFHTLEQDDDGFLALDIENQKRIEKAITETGANVVVFDPLRDFSLDDLNSDKFMGETVRDILRVTKLGNPKRVPLVVHHAATGKAGAQKTTGWDRASFGRNSKVLLMKMRAMINVGQAQPNDNSVILIASGKANNAPEFEPFAARLDFDTMLYARDDDFDMENWREEVSGSRKREAPPIEKTLRKVLKQGQQYDKAQVAKLIMKDKGVVRGTAYRWIDKAEEMNVLHYIKKIDCYELA